ncbi:MAG: hypothetical protein WCL13_02925 [bacterium]
MSEIDFLKNKKEDDPKLKNKDDKKEKLAWSNPKKEVKNFKISPFFFLPFLNKKAPVDKNSASSIEKNKLKESREEILKSIKHHESSALKEGQNKSPSKNFFTAIGEKLTKSENHKQISADYQQIFNQDNIKRNPPAEQADQLAQNLKVQPEKENPKTIKFSKIGEAGWLAKLLKSIRQKITALKAPKAKLAETKTPEKEIGPIVQNKPEVITEVKQEAKRAEEDPAIKRQAKESILETNLIRGEIVTYFDWRQNIITSIFIILIPIFLVGAIYTGVAFYKDSKQTNDREQIEKINQLTEKIKQEEAGLVEISNFQARFKTISQIFSEHVYWTNFFKFLEDNTIKDVYYTGFSGDTSGNYSLEALATSYGNISEQAKFLKDNSQVLDVKISGGEMALGGGSSRPIIKFIFKFSILKSLFTE